MNAIADMRKSYERAELDENASHAQPLAQFDQWLNEAIRSEDRKSTRLNSSHVTTYRMPSSA